MSLSIAVDDTMKMYPSKGYPAAGWVVQPLHKLRGHGDKSCRSRSSSWMWNKRERLRIGAMEMKPVKRLGGEPRLLYDCSRAYV